MSTSNTWLADSLPANSGSRIRKSAFALIVAVLLSTPSPAQQVTTQQPKAQEGLVTQKNLSLALAKTIAEATLAECRSKGFHTAAAVVDRAGQVLVILRDEEATAQVAEMARRKAYTARMFRMTTAEFQKRTLPDQPIAAQRDIADILALSGGVPIKVGNETIGGVGSAGSNLEMDDACAKAGVAKVADLLK